MFEQKLIVAISGHVSLYHINGNTQTFMDYIIGVEMNEQSHRNCFIDGLDPDHWSLPQYRNREGVIKGSYRAYLDEMEFFVHCAGTIYLTSKVINCEGFKPGDGVLQENHLKADMIHSWGVGTWGIFVKFSEKVH